MKIKMDFPSGINGIDKRRKGAYIFQKITDNAFYQVSPVQYFLSFWRVNDKRSDSENNL